MNKNRRVTERLNIFPGLNTALILRTIIPLVIIVVVVGITIYSGFKEIIYNEITEELKSTSLIVDYTYEYAYPGDYKCVGKEEVAVVKGEEVLNGNYELVDRIKEETGYEVTLFYGNTRVLTTIKDDDGKRVVGTTIRQSVVDDVINGGEGHFYDNIKINDDIYFAYYRPVKNGDDTVGMIAILKKSDYISDMVMRAVGPLMLICLLGLVIMAYVSYRYSSGLIKRIHKIKNFIVRISNGNFKERMDFSVTKNNDEISEMARLLEKMQLSLRTLVEQDALTEINNRRYGDKFLLAVQSKSIKYNTPFSVAIADIDFFKKINDTYGHQCGDIVLKNIAQILKKSMTGVGFVARWGGEEFLLVFEKHDLSEAYQYMCMIMDKIREDVVIYNGCEIRVTITCGMAQGSEEPIHMIIGEADNKLYEGKQNGRDRIVR